MRKAERCDMNCWSDQTLQWAVRRLLEMDADAQAVLSGGEALLEDAPASLKEALAHIRSCPSCALTARDLLETELELHAMEGVEQIIALVQAPSWSPSAKAESAEEPEFSEYAVAADSRGLDQRISLDGHGAISLSTRDGRYLVRIFRNKEGEGATAVLLQTHEPDDAGQGQSGQQISLSIDGEDYTFDTDGTARLPAFPAKPPSLVLRTR